MIDQGGGDTSIIGEIPTFDLLDPEDWLQQAEVLEQQGRSEEALEACRRALALWPDIGLAYATQLRLALARNEQGLVLQSLRGLLQTRPDDAELNSQIGAVLSRSGDFAGSIPHLRASVHRMGHANDTLWNYTTALTVTGSYDELLNAEPLLDRMAAEGPSPYPPFTHLAAARLAVGFDRDAVLSAASELQASERWIAPDQVWQTLAEAVAAQQPFSMVRLDYAMARFACYVSRSAHLVLRPQELSAVVNSVWEGWFGAPIETLGVLFLSHLEQLFNISLRTADLFGVPEFDHLRDEPYHFGFLAEMQRSLPAGPAAKFTSFHVVDILHEMMPYLRSLLSGLPFLGVIGPYPTLAGKLGHFCGIGEIRAIMVPGAVAKHGVPAGETADDQLPSRHLQTLEDIAIPFPGAVFLVSAPGPLGIVYCGHIRSLGGIAIDIGSLTDRWAGA